MQAVRVRERERESLGKLESGVVEGEGGRGWKGKGRKGLCIIIGNQDVGSVT